MINEQNIELFDKSFSNPDWSSVYTGGFICDARKYFRI